MTDPRNIVVIVDDEIRASAEVVDRLSLKLPIVSADDCGMLLFDGRRVVVTPTEELVRLAAELPMLSPRELAEEIDFRDELMLAAFEAVRKRADADRKGRPSVEPRATAIQPAPVRTGLREAARRRRQMEKRAARKGMAA